MRALQVPLSDDMQIQIKPLPCYLIFAFFDEAVVPRDIIYIPFSCEASGRRRIFLSIAVLFCFFFIIILFVSHFLVYFTLFFLLFPSYPFSLPLISLFLLSSSSFSPFLLISIFLLLSVPVFTLFLSLQCPDPHECFINEM